MKDDQAFDVVAFAAELVRIPSTDPPGGELAVAERVAAELARLGIAHALDAFAPGRANVIGRVRGGTGRKPLVCSAHLDTVPVGAQPWAFDPFAGDVVDGRLRGRGASDMKSAVAAFVGAAHRLSRRGVALDGDLILAFTAGESANCLGARHLVAQGFQGEIGAFLCGEPSSLDLIVVEKSILWVEVVTTGTLGHVSGAPGVNAIERMVDVLRDLRELELDLPGHPLLSPATITVGRIEGGSAVNLTPDRCRAEIDIRFAPGAGPEAVMAQLAARFGDRAAFRILDFKPAVEEDPASPFATCCAGAIRGILGRAPRILGVSYYSDGAILLDGIDAPFAIVGPGDLGMSGQADETALAENLHAAVEIYCAIAERWLG